MSQNASSVTLELWGRIPFAPVHSHVAFLWSCLCFTTLFRLRASVSMEKQLNDYMSLRKRWAPEELCGCGIIQLLLGPEFWSLWKPALTPSFWQYLWKCLKPQVTSRLRMGHSLLENNAPLRNLFGRGEKALVCFIVKFQLLCEWL